jgi:multidrug efflux pump subunit AcrA (membrane-fusion protein)
MRPVDLGESNDRMVEIVAGLREGERVSLSPPNAAGTATVPRGNALQPR